ncbi:MAG: AfsR/SARP family transcriptional regulator [Solirubrobacterales bacterium]|nr:AfsR/SARP family transcriptional regulator [Solirubrobacterales bacterium]
MQVRILGSLEVQVQTHGEPLALGGRRQRVLVALLALHANSVVSTDRIADALWGEDPPPTSATSVQVAVSKLRRLLGVEEASRLATQAGGYMLRLDPGQLDAEHFGRLVQSAGAAVANGRMDMAVQRLDDGLALWRGPALADLRYEAFAQAEIARLEELRLAALEERVEAALALGRHAEVIPEAEALIREHPLRERLRGQLMLALYRDGRQADALDAYRSARRALMDELGIEPGTQLRDLHHAILNQEPSLIPPPQPVARNVDRLPAPATPLVGREAQLDDLVDLLQRPDVRLVTLTGAPGTGKTRLALEAAMQIADDFDRVAFAPLAQLSDPRLVLYEIARVLGVAESAGRSLWDGIEADLADRRVLLFVDNFEHVIDAADDAARLLAVAPRLKLLATSREALRLSGEHQRDTPPLAGPEAVSLFVQRARAVAPAFELTDQNRHAVEMLCARLDGLPLAIELAAPWVRTMTPQSLVRRLEQPLRTLTRGARDLPTRQQTLRAAIEWSYRLLEVPEASLFRRLSVFAGGCTAPAAQAVCAAGGSLGADPVHVLASLVEKSLLRWGHDAEEQRFALLATVREYAAERLAEASEADELRGLHARHFLALGEAAYRGRMEDERGWIARLDAEHDNLRAALDWLALHQPAGRLQLAGALGWFWTARSHLDEGRRRLDAALDGAPERGPHAARALAGLGELEAWQGELEVALHHLRQASEMWAELGETLEEAAALSTRAYVHFRVGDHEQARAAAAAAADRAQRLGRGDLVDAAQLLYCLMLVAEGDHERAEPLVAEALEAAVAQGDARCEQHARHLLADCALMRGDADAARVRYVRAARLALDLGDRAQAAIDLQGAAMASVAGGSREGGLRLGGAAAAVIEFLGVDDSVVFWDDLLERHLYRPRQELGTHGAQAWEEGRQLSLEDAIARASSAGAPATLAAEGPDARRSAQ